MDFEGLIPIFFVIVWILSVVFGKKKKKGKKDSPLKGIVGKLLSQVKAELEKNAPQGKGNSVWDLLAGGKAGQLESEPAFSSETDPESLTGPDPDFYSGPDLPSTPPPIPEPQQRVKMPALQRDDPGIRAVGGGAEKPLEIDLEKAVIWSEILAPPVAFREHHLLDRWR